MDNFESKYATWGPERSVYSNSDLPDHAVFNSITDHPEFGDERRFTKIAELGKKCVDSITLESDKQYEVHIYYHNNAKKDFNKKEYKQKGIARRTKLSVSFPKILKYGEKGSIRAVIMSETTNPVSVWSEASLMASESILIHCEENSIKIYTNEERWNVNGMRLSKEELFSKEGTFLGVTHLDGTIRGGEKHAGKVTFTIRTSTLPYGMSDTNFETYTKKKEVKEPSILGQKNENSISKEKPVEMGLWQKDTVPPVSDFFTSFVEKSDSEDMQNQTMESIKKKDVRSLFYAGLNYEHRMKNYNEAVKYYKEAAEQGYVDAQCSLAYMHEHGLGVEKSYSEAIKWYEKAAKQGSNRAKENLEYLKKK